MDVFVEDLFVSFRVKAKENIRHCGDVFFVRKGASALGMQFSKLSDRSLNKRRMFLVQIKTTE